MSKPNLISDQASSAEELKDLLRIMQLESSQRKKSHINYLVDIMQIIPFFIKFRDEGDEFSQRLLCKYLKYEYYAQSQMVFRTGQYGDKFYIILAGKVGVYAEKHQMLNLQEVLSDKNSKVPIEIKKSDDIKLIKVLDAGASFGEMALYDENSQRVSSVYAHSDTFLGVIKREDYLNVIRVKEERQRQKNVKNLCSMSLFQGWNMRDIQVIAAKIRTLVCNKDEIIYQENQLVQSVFLVLSGTLMITKTQVNHEWEDFHTSVTEIMNKEEKKQQQIYHTRQIQSHELFGEEEILYGQKKRNHKVTCLSDGSVIYQMDIATFENDILNKNANTKQEIIKRLQNKIEDLSQESQEQKVEYQNLLTKNYKTINLKFDREDKEKQIMSQRDKSNRKVDKNERNVSVSNIQDTQRSRKKIIISKKQMGKSSNMLNQSLNHSPRQSSIENLRSEMKNSLSGYGAEYISLDKDYLKSAQKITITPQKEKSALKNEALRDLPSLYQKVKASIIQQSDTTKNPNSLVLQNPESFILNFLPGVNKDLTNQMEQLHSQRNQELQDNLLKKIQRTKTTESTHKLPNNSLFGQQDGVKGSQIFTNFDQLQRKKKILIEKAFYYRNQEQNQQQQLQQQQHQIQQQQQQAANSFSLHYGDQNYPMAVVLPNKLYKDPHKRSKSINSIQVTTDDYQYKQSLKKYLLTQAQKQNRDKVNEMYNTDIENTITLNNSSESHLILNNSSIHKKRLSHRSQQPVSLRSSPRNMQGRKLQPLHQQY